MSTRTWTRAESPKICGHCRGARVIKVGEPMVVFTLPGSSLKRYRCQSCEGPAPPDLAPLVPRAAPTFKPLVHVLTGPDALPLDFKHAAAERVPGEDDQ